MTDKERYLLKVLAQIIIDKQQTLNLSNMDLREIVATLAVIESEEYN